MKRKFKQCEWCETTIDITNENKDLCNYCSEYNSKEEMLNSK